MPGIASLHIGSTRVHRILKAHSNQPAARSHRLALWPIVPQATPAARPRPRAFSAKSRTNTCCGYRVGVSTRSSSTGQITGCAAIAGVGTRARSAPSIAAVRISCASIATPTPSPQRAVRSAAHRNSTNL